MELRDPCQGPAGQLNRDQGVARKAFEIFAELHAAKEELAALENSQ
ncbi:hypothetical protein [Mesorhizobium sp. WSM3882]|nr:hypothetical protein [Mesorhizobium sp. WSM3882]